jgi:hypothetical protein
MTAGTHPIYTQNRFSMQKRNEYPDILYVILSPEIMLATDSTYTYMKYHQADDTDNIGTLMIFTKNPDAKWLEDYGSPVSESTPDYQI